MDLVQTVIPILAGQALVCAHHLLESLLLPGVAGIFVWAEEGGERVSVRWSLPRGSGAERRDVSLQSRRRAGAGIRGSQGSALGTYPG